MRGRNLPPWLILSVLPLLMALLSGCAVTPKTESGFVLPVRADYYKIVFHQQRQSSFKEYAHYRILDSASGSVIAAVPSEIKCDVRGVNGNRLLAGRDFSPVAAVSPTGKTIIITEDCWEAVPFNTYLVVRVQPNGRASSIYRDIPKERDSSIYGILAKIESLDDETVTVSYHGGVVKRLAIDAIPELTEDTPRT